MSTKELINRAFEKDATGFSSIFEEIMESRIAKVIEDKYDSMFEAKDCDDDEKDEDEDVADEDDDEDED